MIYQIDMRDVAGFQEAIKTPFHFGIDVAIVYLFMEVVSVHELFRDHLDRNVDPF